MVISPQIKVQVGPPEALSPQINVRIGPTGAFQPAGAGSGITLKNSVNDVTRLDQLRDVVEPTDATDGSALIYHADTDKYVVQTINLDGGTF